MAADAEIKGYKEFQKALDEIGRDMPKSMQDAGMTIARDWVAAAKGKASTPQEKIAVNGLSVGGTEETGGSITASSPLWYGAEFGGQGRPSTMHFPPHMGRRGYFFYPAARANADRFNAIWQDGIDKAMEAWNHQERAG